jgi:CubicO group peptidase (beta-lactamase class C family)
MHKTDADRIDSLLRDLRPESRSPRGRPAQSLDERMRQLFTPGVSIAVVDNFELAWAGGFGVRKRREEGAVSANTLFQAASISKPIFALAVMRLAKSGVLKLDADVNEYLLSWRVPDSAGWRPRITVRQLLSHTAGTTEHGFAGYLPSAPLPALTEVLNGVPPANSGAIVVDLLPGLQARYSGGGTTIAQQVVIDVLGRPLPEIMRELVLDPLQMSRSTYEQPLPARLAGDAALAHGWDGAPLSGGWHVYPEIAAAGLWTTAADLARLAKELMRILRGDESALGLDRDAIDDMLRPQLPDQKVGGDYYGIGWLCAGQGDAFQFGHGGRNEGYVSSIRLLPARGKAAVVLLNSNRGFPLREEIVAAIGRYYEWPAAASVPKVVAMSSDVNYAGTYRDPLGFTFRVAQTKGGLLLQFGAQQSLPLDPISPLEFAGDVLDLKVSFAAGEHGAIVSMTVTQGGKVIVAARQNNPADPAPDLNRSQ